MLKQCSCCCCWWHCRWSWPSSWSYTTCWPSTPWSSRCLWRTSGTGSGWWRRRGARWRRTSSSASSCPGGTGTWSWKVWRASCPSRTPRTPARTLSPRRRRTRGSWNRSCYDHIVIILWSYCDQRAWRQTLGLSQVLWLHMMPVGPSSQPTIWSPPSVDSSVSGGFGNWIWAYTWDNGMELVFVSRFLSSQNVCP